MNDSVELFKAEQSRLAEQDGPARAFIGQVKGGALSLASFALVMFVLIEGFSGTPRNPDNSLKLTYYAPVLTILAVGSAILLRRREFRRSPLGLTAWGLILLAVIAIPAGTLAMLLPNVR